MHMHKVDAIYNNNRTQSNNRSSNQSENRNQNQNEKENNLYNENPLGGKWDFFGIFWGLAVEIVEKYLTYVRDCRESQCSPTCNRWAVQSLGFCVSLLRKPCEECYFLVPNKKVTKEVGLERR